ERERERVGERERERERKSTCAGSTVRSGCLHSHTGSHGRSWAFCGTEPHSHMGSAGMHLCSSYHRSLRCTSTHTHTHTHRHTHTHTHIHTHTHTHISHLHLFLLQ